MAPPPPLGSIPEPLPARTPLWLFIGVLLLRFASHPSGSIVLPAPARIRVVVVIAASWCRGPPPVSPSGRSGSRSRRGAAWSCASWPPRDRRQPFGSIMEVQPARTYVVIFIVRLLRGGGQGRPLGSISPPWPARAAVWIRILGSSRQPIGSMRQPVPARMQVFVVIGRLPGGWFAADVSRSGRSSRRRRRGCGCWWSSLPPGGWFSRAGRPGRAGGHRLRECGCWWSSLSPGGWFSRAGRPGRARGRRLRECGCWSPSPPPGGWFAADVSRPGPRPGRCPRGAASWCAWLASAVGVHPAAAPVGVHPRAAAGADPRGRLHRRAQPFGSMLEPAPFGSIPGPPPARTCVFVSISSSVSRSGPWPIRRRWDPASGRYRRGCAWWLPSLSSLSRGTDVRPERSPRPRGRRGSAVGVDAPAVSGADLRARRHRRISGQPSGSMPGPRPARMCVVVVIALVAFVACRVSRWGRAPSPSARTWVCVVIGGLSRRGRCPSRGRRGRWSWWSSAVSPFSRWGRCRRRGRPGRGW